MATRLKPVLSSRTGRPIMVLLDLLGRRWTLRIIWELRAVAMTSRRLREICDDVSPTVLQTRLNDLRAAGFVSLERPGGYRLTPLGQELLRRFLPLQVFADSWAATLPAPEADG